eukprot:TRINITY_DN79064_c0_g1_i1.p1 TRINITY_DN79064_c0_g1~~TRINITY_DN79064_c0_g1_i1.p1  ORF type:complete len:409 (+),score=66.27 TRINITY_DN79064_c0_g1_i1:89-1315(+)
MWSLLLLLSISLLHGTAAELSGDDDAQCLLQGAMSGWSSLRKAGNAKEQDVYVHGINEAEFVSDYKLNPIIKPPGLLNWIVGDPTVLQIGDQIHMWTNGAMCCIQHYVANASNPTSFKQLKDAITGLKAIETVRPYAYLSGDNKTVTLFYERYWLPEPFGHFCKSAMYAAQAEVGIWDFKVTGQILKPDLEWEKINPSHCGRRVGNPYVFYNKIEGKYWLYYSASTVWLEDSQIGEPINFGLAKADNLLGPYERILKNPMVVTGGIPGLEIIGNGSLKIIKGHEAMIDNSGKGVAICNRITRNTTSGQTGSTMVMLRTVDGGLSWETVISPFIAPTLVPGDWKEAYVYAFDTLPDPTDPEYMLVYYNARNGWRDGHETAGVSRFPVEIIASAKEGSTAGRKKEDSRNK